jgi:hypothetical protein
LCLNRTELGISESSVFRIPGRGNGQSEGREMGPDVKRDDIPMGKIKRTELEKHILLDTTTKNKSIQYYMPDGI